MMIQCSNASHCLILMITILCFRKLTLPLALPFCLIYYFLYVLKDIKYKEPVFKANVQF